MLMFQVIYRKFFHPLLRACRPKAFAGSQLLVRMCLHVSLSSDSHQLSRLWCGTMGTTCARRPLSPTSAVMGNSHSTRLLPAADQGQITASCCEPAPVRETLRANRRRGRAHAPSLSTPR